MRNANSFLSMQADGWKRTAERMEREATRFGLTAAQRRAIESEAARARAHAFRFLAALAAGRRRVA